MCIFFISTLLENIFTPEKPFPYLDPSLGHHASLCPECAKERQGEWRPRNPPRPGGLWHIDRRVPTSLAPLNHSRVPSRLASFFEYWFDHRGNISSSSHSFLSPTEALSLPRKTPPVISSSVPKLSMKLSSKVSPPTLSLLFLNAP
jgi:hypothetical protein